MRKINSAGILRYVFTIKEDKLEENTLNGISKYFNFLLECSRKKVINAEPSRFVSSLFNILLYLCATDNSITEHEFKFINRVLLDLNVKKKTVEEMAQIVKDVSFIESLDFCIESFKKPRFLVNDGYEFYDFIFGLFCFSRLANNQINENQYRFICDFFDPDIDEIVDPEELNNYL